MLTQITRALASRFKPHRTEAIARIRFNALWLVSLLVLTSILPGVPSLPTAVGVTLLHRWGNVEEGEGFWTWACLAESIFAAITLFNISESFYALKYPRASAPPTPSSVSRPALGLKSSLSQGTPAKKKLFDGVSLSSPNSSPQPQKPFAFSSSLSSSLSSSGSSTPLSSSSSYPLSPLSTPSRTLSYGTSSLSSTRSLASSTSTVGYTPSPQSRTLAGISATGSPSLGASYRGRAFGGSTARPLDGSYLGRIAKTDNGDDDEY